MGSKNWDKITKSAESIDDSTHDFLNRIVTNSDELREAISFLIHRRELLRDCEIEQLQHACDELLEQLADRKQQMLLEELACFKEVMALYRRLPKNHDKL